MFSQALAGRKREVDLDGDADGQPEQGSPAMGWDRHPPPGHLCGVWYQPGDSEMGSVCELSLNDRKQQFHVGV